MAESRALRIGIIGCGQVAMQGALPGLSRPGSDIVQDAAPFLSFGGAEDVEIVAVADTDPGRAAAAASRFGIGSIYLDGFELLDQVPMDAVVICTPPRFHLGYACAGLERGLSVLVEKPASTSARELDRLTSTRAAHRPQSCLVNASWAYHPAVAVTAGLITRGEIGIARQAEVVFEHGGPQDWSPNAAWYRDTELGGVVTDLGLHSLVLLENVLGGPTTELRPGAFGPDPLERAQADATIGGTAVRISLGWDAPSPRFIVSIAGDDGEIVLSLIPWTGKPHRPTAQIQRSSSGEPVALELPAESYAGGPYRQFATSVRTGTAGLTDIDAVANALSFMLKWKSAIPAA
jgi:predicted dehydrogenase